MELQFLDLLQQLRTPFGDVFMPLVTKLGNAGIFWIFLTLVLLLFPKTRKVGAVAAAALILDLILCNGILKPLIARIRPYDVNTAIKLLIPKENDYSFPSGHTAASFAAASAILFAGKKKLGWAAIVLASVIAFSRLYLYMHYPTDVLGGIAVGIFCGWAGWYLVQKIQKRIAENRKTKQKEIKTDNT